MIRVSPQPEPSDFALKVTLPGEQWLKDQKWYDTSRPNDYQKAPKRTEFPPFWTGISKEIYDAYNGICAYLGIYFEYVSGASSVDHFLPKTKFPGLAYKWMNYRLSCLGINRRKNSNTNILDPFEIEDDWFDVDMQTGAIYPNLLLEDDLKARVQDTIDELGLDQQVYREMRHRHVLHALKREIKESYLRETSPFIWKVLKRHGLI